VAKFTLLIRNLRDLQRGNTPPKLWVETLQPAMACWASDYPFPSRFVIPLRGLLFIPPLDGDGCEPALRHYELIVPAFAGMTPVGGAHEKLIPAPASALIVMSPRPPKGRAHEAS
jgi:hypothetical protein